MISLTVSMILALSGVTLGIYGVHKKHNIVVVIIRFINGIIGIG